MIKSQTQKAREQFKKAMEMFPENVDYNFNLAQAASELDDHEVAISKYKKVILLDNEQGQTADKTERSYLALGRIYSEKLKDKKRAIRVYKKLLEILPEHDQARANLNRLQK